MATMLDEALAYARRGWYVFPCREKPGQPYTKDGETLIPQEKTPYVSKGLHMATLDEEQIRSWWKTWEYALIGINAGKSGLFVVDIDKKHVNGWDTYSAWGINDSAGLRSLTPSGGMHVVFTGTGKSSTNAKTGIDTRGEGGYFIAPPSHILEGEYCGEYKRQNDWSQKPGVIPDGLMAKLFPNSTTEYVRGGNGNGNGKKQLSNATLNFMLKGAEPGERNSKLFKAAADFAGCGYSYEEAKEFLSPICAKSGLSASEIEMTLTHAYSKPRTPSIPDSIQEKIMLGDKNVVTQITFEEQAIMENAVLACMLLDRQTIGMMQDMLSPDDFAVAKNTVIYRVIMEMHARGMSVDHLTLSNELIKKQTNVTLDDITRLTSLYMVSSENALTYASIIKEKSGLRRLEALLDNKDKYIKKNLADGIFSLEKDVANIAISSGAKTSAILTASQATFEVREYTEKLVTGQIEQLKTGFTDYDNNVGGIYSNELIVCAGRSGDGKSALALSIINYVSLINKTPSALLSLEMSNHESVCRLICQLTGIPFKKVYQGKMNSSEWASYREAMDRISNSNIYFDDGDMDIREIRAKIRRLADSGVRLVAVDQLEQIRGYEGMRPFERYNQIAYDMKTFTNEFDVPIILSHQMNRNIMDRKLKNPEPILSDLNQAGEKPANQVWVISHKRDDNGIILQSKIKMLKNRNGPRIEWAVVFVGERMLFSNPVREEDKYVFHAGDEQEEQVAFWEN